MLAQELRHAARALRSSPGFTAVAALSLALGIGANTAIFSLIDAVTLRSLPVQHPEQLVEVMIGKNESFTNPIWEQLRDRQDVFSGLFAWSSRQFNLSATGEARYVTGMWTSGDMPSTLGVSAILGRTLTAADDRRGCAARAMLTYSFWQTEYSGDPNVLEKRIYLDGHPFQIIGVTQPGFTGGDVGKPLSVIAPICTEQLTRGENSALDRRSNWWLEVMGRHAPGISPAQVKARLKMLAPDVFRASVPLTWNLNNQKDFMKQSFDVRPSGTGLSGLRQQYTQPLIVLMAVAGIVLLVACANVANLLLARGAAREREIAVRIALGSTRVRLIRQLLAESLLLAASGAALGIVFAQWGSRLLIGFLDAGRETVFLDLTIDWRVLGFTAAVACATALIFGLAPAWRSSRVEPQTAIKAGGRGTTQSYGRSGFGRTLVAAQVALSLLLVSAAGLLTATFRKLVSLDPGFNRARVLLITIDLHNGHYPKDRRTAAYRDIAARIAAVPGVRSASYSFLTPVSGWSWNESVVVEGRKASTFSELEAYVNQVSPRSFETLGTPLLAGRDFNDNDTPHSPRVAIINETMARKFFGGANPVGHYYRLQEPTNLGPPIQIIGLVKDARYQSLRKDSPPVTYMAASQAETPELSTVFEALAMDDPKNAIAGIKERVMEFDRSAAMSFKTFSAQVDESLTRERLLATLSGFFGGLGLLLAALGLHGVMSYNVARRRNEIGIRMALGAQQRRVLGMVLRDAAVVTCFGLAGGLIAALFTTRLLASFLYGLQPRDPWTLAGSAAVLAAAAALAGYLPAWRASKVDPLTALRDE